MQYSLLRSLVLLCCCTAALLFSVGCDSTTTGPKTTDPPDTAQIMVSFKLQAVSGVTPLTFGTPMTMESGTQFKVSMLRFYVSQFFLLDSAGNSVSALLVDSAGNPLAHELTFWDHAKPETQTIHILARKGKYKGITFSVGVPNTTTAGAPLNHADASQQPYPLDVDNDMYWGWNSGYVFLKIEGSALINDKWEGFVYHVGGDTRLATPRMETPFTIKAAGEERTLLVNANRLFVTPSGGHVPDITGAPAERMVHGGSAADSMAVNITKSGFITLKP